MIKRNIIPLFSFFFACLLAAQFVHATSDLAYLIDVNSTNFLPTPIRAGDIVSMAVNITNKGAVYSAIDLNGTLDVGTRFEPIDSNYNIPLINAGAMQTLVFKFRVKQDTLAGYYPVFLTMTYNRNGESVKETQTLLVPVTKSEKNIDVTVEPKVINPGNQTNLVFTLANISGSHISNISFSWSEKTALVLPVGSDNKRYVSLLESGKATQVSYTVAADPNITPGIYPFDVNMTFTDSGGTKSQVSQVGIIIGGTTDFEVSAEISSAGQLSLSIANIGSNNASAVVVKIPQQQAVRVQGSNISILGNLNKGDYTLANFTTQTAQLDRNALRQFAARDQQSDGQQSGTIPNSARDQNFFAGALANSVIVEIDYTDTTGERQAVQKTIQLSSSSTTGLGLSGFQSRGNSNQLSFAPWVLLVVIAGAAAYFNRAKAKREWKPLLAILAIIAILFLAVIFFFNADLLSSLVVAIFSVVLLAVFFRKGIPNSLQAKVFAKSKRE